MFFRMALFSGVTSDTKGLFHNPPVNVETTATTLRT